MTEDKWDRETLQKPTLHKLNTTQKKPTTQNTAKNYSGPVDSYDTWPRNKVGLYYNAPKPTQGQ